MIVSIDGKAVESADDVVQAVGDKQPGDSVEIQYYRGSAKHTANIKLGERPKQLSSTSSEPSPNGGDGLPFNLP